MPDVDQTTPSPVQTGSFLPSEIGEIPRFPGVYMMFSAKGKVVYIGKSVNLRSRVRQYFSETGGDLRQSVPLIRQATHHIETIVTVNEKEAFLLENTLIKRHKPRYNVRLRDDKAYVSVRIDPSQKWPRARVLRPRRGSQGEKAKDRRALYFGPYSDARAIRETMSQLQRVFPLRSCTDSVLRNRSRPCMLHQIGRCCAPCVGLVTEEEYADLVRSTVLFLKGNTGDLADRMRREMDEASEAMQFERAALLRDRIAALERSVERQRVSSHGVAERDVVGYYEEEGQAAIVLMFFRDGHLVETRKWIVPVHGHTLREALSNFLGQYYGEGRLVPREILLPGNVDSEADGQPVIEEWLSELRGGRVSLLVPQRGEKHRQVALAGRNAREILARRLSGADQIRSMQEDLGRRLRLDEPPRTIECYDIATLQGAMSVGAKVVFRDGEPHKAGYRLFRIRTVSGQDDFGMMREVLERRFRGAIDKGEELPHLVVVDGGKGQLSVAGAALEEIGVSGVALAALAKGRLKTEGSGEGDVQSTEQKRTPERLFVPGRKNPVVFPARAPSFYLLQRLRDEAHRFVNTYHVKVRHRANLRSSLEDVPGVGAKRARALLRHFGSLARVRGAGLDELAQVSGITPSLAAAIQSHVGRGAGEGAE